ncbi:hypothetical protein DPMN_009060 [Dreissena polymorpha]|uniref:Uncharacterized protein n=1 Tax=Dreissena polymorpha TaxID=45954 RepID=A0A9D4N1M7_DREPO|nr:hypothetical protein DPMN_009060 [Dreissena polymorpha]
MREAEEMKHRMMIEQRLILENKFEQKRQVEKELLRNIEQLELQERALVQQQSRNEILDRELTIRRMKEDDMKNNKKC